MASAPTQRCQAGIYGSRWIIPRVFRRKTLGSGYCETSGPVGMEKNTEWTSSGQPEVCRPPVVREGSKVGDHWSRPQRKHLKR